RVLVEDQPSAPAASMYIVEVRAAKYVQKEYVVDKGGEEGKWKRLNRMSDLIAACVWCVMMKLRGKEAG
ncbi:hypothetical protein K402DRAFT_388412, partial [Aulographum hederae CBS 113979]